MVPGVVQERRTSLDGHKNQQDGATNMNNDVHRAFWKCRFLYGYPKILITERKRQYIHLLAIPGLLPKAKKTEENARDRPDHHETPFFLQTTIQLPPYWILKDIIFYGDDGNSSRISSTASAGAAEGRQNLFLLVVPDATQNYHVEKGTELWVLNYESVHWSLQTYAEGTDIQVNRSGDQLKVAAEVVLEKENKDIAEHHDGRIFLFPKSKHQNCQAP